MSPTDLIRNYPHLVVLGTGLSFGFIVVSNLVFEFVFIFLNDEWKAEPISQMVYWFQGRIILAHICDEPKGLKTNMCMV